MPRKSPSTNISNGIEIHERMVRIETKIDSIKETLDKVVSWQGEKAKQLEEHEKFISTQKTMNKLFWTLLVALLTTIIALIVRHAFEKGLI